MKRILFFLSIGFSILSEAQAPLLPLFDNSSRWKIEGWEIGGFFSQGTTHELSYSLGRDTVINGKDYKVLLRRYKSSDVCNTTPCPIEIGKSGMDTLLVSQVGNTVSTSDGDTLFSMSGTTEGDSIKLNYTYSKLWPFPKTEYLKITKVDWVDVGSQKMRLFTFGHPFLDIRFFYIDGLGFSTGGPLPESGYYELAERLSYLTCYQSGNNSFVVARSPIAITPSSGTCHLITTTYEKKLINSMKIYVNESHELVHDLMADRIEIVNSIGQQVLSNQNAFKTDLNPLAPGVYVAKLVMAAQTKSYRFMLQ